MQKCCSFILNLKSLMYLTYRFGVSLKTAVIFDGEHDFEEPKLP